MTQKQKIQYMRIGLAMAGVAVVDKTADLIVSVYELTMKKKGNTDLGDIVRVQAEIERKYKVDTQIKVRKKGVKK